MLNRLRSLLRPPERKSSMTARLIAIESGGRARWTPRDYAALAREGYTRNAIVHRAVRLTAESIGALSFVLYEGAAELDRASAARSSGAAEPAPGRRRRSWKASPRICCSPAMPISRRSASTASRRAAGARALRAAARPHEGGAGAGRLAGGLRLHRRRARPCASTRPRRCRRSCI